MHHQVTLILTAAMVLHAASVGFAQDKAGSPARENLVDPSSPFGGRSSPPAKLQAPRPAAPRLPVPDATEVKDARKLIRQTFADLFKDGEKNPGLLVQRLLASVDQTDEPGRKLAMLLEAQDVATSAGDITTVLTIIDTRARLFDDNHLKTRLETLRDLTTPKIKSDPRSLDQLYSFTLDLVDSALEVDDVASARAACLLGAGFAKSLTMVGRSKKDARVLASGEAKQTETRDLLKVIDARSKLLASYTAAAKTLETEPDDPQANGIAGAYACFVKHEWDKGLLALTKSDQHELAILAATEISLMNRNSDPKRVFDLAGKWWGIAEGGKHDAALEEILKVHASSRYGDIKNDLVDPLDKALADKRAGHVKRAKNTSAQKKGVDPVPFTAWTSGTCWLVVRENGSVLAFLASTAQSTLAVPSTWPMAGKWNQTSTTGITMQFDNSVSASCQIANDTTRIAVFRSASGGSTTRVFRKVEGANSLWLWFNRRIFTFLEDGRIESEPGSQWQRSGNTVVIRWQNGLIDTLEVSPEGDRLTGRNQHGSSVGGVLIR